MLVIHDFPLWVTWFHRQFQGRREERWTKITKMMCRPGLLGQVVFQGFFITYLISFLRYFLIVYLLKLKYTRDYANQRFPSSSVGKESAYSAGDTSNMGSIPGSGRSPGEGNGNPLHYSWWGIPWTEEPSGLQSMGSQTIGHDRTTKPASP